MFHRYRSASISSIFIFDIEFYIVSRYRRSFSDVRYRVNIESISLYTDVVCLTYDIVLCQGSRCCRMLAFGTNWQYTIVGTLSSCMQPEGSTDSEIEFGQSGPGWPARRRGSESEKHPLEGLRRGARARHSS